MNTLKIGLVGCSKTKVGYAAPAREFYQGTLFKKASNYCQQTYDKWFILSAKYGLLEPDRIIKPYDTTLNNMKSNDIDWWAANTALDLEQYYGAVFYLHAGKKYQTVCKHIAKPRIGKPESKFIFPLKGLGIGHQLAWYKERGF